MQKVIAYIRVSTGRQAEEGYSIEGQTQLLQEYAARNGLEIVDTITESESAYTSGRRPGFARLVKALRAKRATAVLCYKLDRALRNITDYALLTESLKVAVISATEGEMSDTQNSLTGIIRAAVARDESKKISERTRLGMRTKAKGGEYPTYAPTGYVNLDGNVVPDPRRADLIARMFEKYAYSDASISDLVEWSRKAGLTSRSGVLLNKSMVYSILTNPVHAGDIRWREDVYQGKHAPIVSRAVFAAVQERLRGGGHAMGTTHSFPYRGLLVCGYCGCHLTATLAKGKYIYYHCTHSRGPCEQPYHRQDRLSELLASVIDGVHISSEIASFLRDQLRADAEEMRAVRRTLRLDLKSRQDDLEHKLLLTHDEKLEGEIDPALWERAYTTYTEQLTAIKQEIHELSVQVEPTTEDVESTFELLERGPEFYRLESDEKRAEHLRMVASNCQVFAENVIPAYKKPFGAFAESIRSSDWLPGEDSNLQPFG